MHSGVGAVDYRTPLRNAPCTECAAMRSADISGDRLDAETSGMLGRVHTQLGTLSMASIHERYWYILADCVQYGLFERYC
jgi:hypothetical protein